MAFRLRVCVLWGEQVLRFRELKWGEPGCFGSAPSALLPAIGKVPRTRVLDPSEDGWLLNARGATSGRLFLGGQALPIQAAWRQPVQLRPGDCGLLQYGELAVFFQWAQPSVEPIPKRATDPRTALAIAFALVLVMGGLLVLRALSTQAPGPMPLELTTQSVLMRQLAVKISAQDAAAARPTAAKPSPKPDVKPSPEPDAKLSPEPDVKELLRLREALEQLLPAGTRQDEVPSDGGSEPMAAALQLEGALSPAQVRAAVVRRGAALARCTRDHAAARRVGRVVIAFKLHPAGHVREAKMMHSDPGLFGVDRCLLDVFRELRFPAAENPTTGQYTVVIEELPQVPNE